MEHLTNILGTAPQLAALAASVGVLSHLSYFIHGEHHLYAITYVRITFIAPFILSFIISRLQEISILSAIKTSLLLESSFFAGLWASMLIYRTLFHPLRSFAGPWQLRLSKFVHTSYIIGKLDSYKHLDAWHETYGDFLRTGPNELSIVHPDAVEAIMGARSTCTRSAWYDMGHPLISLLQTRDKALHDKRRKVWDRGFSMKALDGYQSRVKGFADLLVDQIASFSGQSLNVSRWFNYYSFDVMGELAFGQSFDMLKTGEKHDVIHLLDEGQRPLGQFGYMHWLMMVIVRVPGLGSGYKRWLAYCEEHVEKRKGMDIKERDIMSWLLEAEPMSTDPAINHLWTVGDSRLIIVAGSDTTAATLTFLFYHLCKDPALVQKLREELKSVQKEDGSFDVKDLGNADFLNGLINETLRLHPPVPSGVSRLTPPEGVMIGDKKVPGNVIVSVPLYTMFRSSKAFQMPHDFIPERWSTQPDLVINKTVYAPFSVGRYGCIGKNLALMELRTVTAELVNKFDVSFAKGEDGYKLINESEDYFTIGLKDLNLSFQPRK